MVSCGCGPERKTGRLHKMTSATLCKKKHVSGHHALTRRSGVMQTDSLLSEAKGHDDERAFENRDFIVNSAQ